MRFEIEEQQRAQDPRIAHRDRQLQHPGMGRPIDQPQVQPDGGRAAIGALECERQRIQQPREHERQWLEAVDRPFQLHLLAVPRHIRIRHERTRIDPSRQLL